MAESFPVWPWKAQSIPTTAPPATLGDGRLRSEERITWFTYVPTMGRSSCSLSLQAVVISSANERGRSDPASLSINWRRPGTAIHGGCPGSLEGTPLLLPQRLHWIERRRTPRRYPRRQRRDEQEQHHHHCVGCWIARAHADQHRLHQLG